MLNAMCLTLIDGTVKCKTWVKTKLAEITDSSAFAWRLLTPLVWLLISLLVCLIAEREIDVLFLDQFKLLGFKLSSRICLHTERVNALLVIG